MGFKLVRIDSQDPFKIPLQVGTHLIGRGKFLDCDDKRVSRNHGELVVSDDSVTIKALHRNPVFYIKKAIQSETGILTQNCTLELYNGDKFGLLPDIYWYEVIYCINKELSNEIEPVNREQDNNLMDTMVKNEESISDSPSLLDTMVKKEDSTPESPSLLTEVPEQHPTQNYQVSQSSNQILNKQSLNLSDSQSTIPDLQNEELDQQVEKEKCPIKRALSVNSVGNSSGETKKIKVESDIKNEPIDVQTGSNNVQAGSNDVQAGSNDVQTGSNNVLAGSNDVQIGTNDVKDEPSDAQAGPSCKQAADSSTSNNKPGSPSSPVKPPAALPRERCLYGANCYRKNPVHKARFSHPADADWGAGPVGTCPRGARCRRRDPRHWTHHAHPAGAAPPPPRAPGDAPQAGKRRKEKKKKYSSDEDTPAEDLILTGKRPRKTIPRPEFSDSESESDPYNTDGSDEWQPSGNMDSQIYSQDY